MTVAPGPFDLTTLAAAKAAAKVPTGTGGDDDLLQRSVTSLSRTFLTKCNRASFYGRTVSAALTAQQAGYLIMPDYPVTSVSALAAIGGAIPAAVAPTPGAPNQPTGYLLEQWDGMPPGNAQRLTLYGYGFPRGQVGGVPITYRAGYEVISEAATIPAATAYTIAPAAAYGPAMVDSGVVLASTGVAFVRVAGGATPTTGQYKFTQDAATGLWGYTFAAADAGVAVLISYSYSPADVFGAVAEWVAERYKYRDRMSERTRSTAAQQTASFAIDDAPIFVRGVIDQYTAVGPLF